MGTYVTATNSPLSERVGPKWAAVPDGEELLAMMGEAEPDASRYALASTATAAVTAAALGYTRGRGFTEVGNTVEVADDVRGAIITAAMRFFQNPTSARRIEAGSFSSVPGTFEGWTSTELAVLRRYRRRTA